MVQCLYKKFTLRTGKEFTQSEFKKVMKSIGQLALQTLMSGNPLLRRVEVHKMIGDFAFEYGLFAGHEDLRLVSDLTADIYVMYPHRSLEEFFGSWGFIKALCDNQTVDDIFTMNPLFLRFCLWFLSSPGLDFPCRHSCYDTLTSFVAEGIDAIVLKPEIIESKFPAIDMVSSDDHSDHLKMDFFRDILNKCTKIRIVQLIRSDMAMTFDTNTLFFSEIIENFFPLIWGSDIIDRLTNVAINEFIPRNTDGDALTLSIDAGFDYGIFLLDIIFNQQVVNLSQRNLEVHLILGSNDPKRGRYDIMQLCKHGQHIKELHVINTEQFGQGLKIIEATRELPNCPIVTDIYFNFFHIDESIPAVSNRAIQSGKLPCLRSVSLTECCKHSCDLNWPKEIQIYLKDIHFGLGCFHE